ncbi:MAG: lipid-A-disaccharide synthase [Planctomycetota bacterium]|jgi:lipid-A-disaccharide synthase
MEEYKSKRIFISALEHSAEMHCANLIKAVHGHHPPDVVWPDTLFDLPPLGEPPTIMNWVGFGGERMNDLGCQLLDNTVKRAAMIYNVLGQLGYYKKLIKQANQYFAQNEVDLVIVCDSPAFNFHIAKAAKKHGIPVLFYVAPQLWAWAPWRIHKLKRCCDKLACILPFEKDWFTKRGVDAEFVSNPLFDESEIDLQKNYKGYLKYNPKAPKIALLPGSRQAEIDTLWPAMLDAAIELKQLHPGATFTACAPDEEKLSHLQEFAENIEEYGIKIKYKAGALIDVARKADFALVASGSATLQVAAAGCPMTIMYQSNKLVWHLLGRWLIRIRFLSLVNILASKELVPEFMPYFSSIEPIIERTHNLLCAPSRLAQTSQDLVELIRPLAERRASDAVADIVINMLGLEIND